MSRLRFKITSRVLGTNIVGGQWSNPNTLYPVPYTGEKQRAKNRARNPEGWNSRGVSCRTDPREARDSE